MSEPAFTLGIEEEYLLVDRVSRDLVVDPPAALFEEAQAALGLHVSPEFMRSQIEIGTGICTSLAEARTQLKRFRAIATRFEKSARNFLALTQVACAWLWLEQN